MVKLCEDLTVETVTELFEFIDKLGVKMTKKTFSTLFIAIIFLLFSGCSAFKSQGNIQYIPESIKDLPKESLAEIYLSDALHHKNQELFSIDGIGIKVPHQGLMAELNNAMQTQNRELWIYVNEGEHTYKYYQTYSVTQYHKYGETVYRDKMVVKPGYLTHTKTKTVKESYYFKGGLKYIWDSYNKCFITNE